jgi:NAD(P)-dependent dehydrogenase (short-subunit alcohol dehydrogenase family)
LSVENFRQLIDANLTGSFLCARAFLPGMRERGEGTIVNIVSDAGLQASAKSGAAYAASKFGQRGLTQSINAEERGRGIRACAILPGDIDTPLLDKRPQPPPAESRRRMLRPDDVAECVMLAINLPQHAVIEELLIRPR